MPPYLGLEIACPRRWLHRARLCKGVLNEHCRIERMDTATRPAGWGILEAVCRVQPVSQPTWWRAIINPESMCDFAHDVWMQVVGIRFALISAFCFAAFSGVVEAAIPATERQALLDLYVSTHGTGWSMKTNWNGPAGTECSWFGVTCDIGQNHVTGLLLIANNLSGTLPYDINKLTGLQFFEASYNQLGGPIPSLDGLSALQYFRIVGNQFTGSIPALSSLASLHEFTAEENLLTGPIPSLAGLTNLYTFAVSQNQLTGSIPPLDGLTNLRYFVADHNLLTGWIPEISGLNNLFQFGVNDNQLTGSIPALNNTPQLTAFTVENNHLTGSLPSLVAAPSLDTFSAFGNSLSGPIPSLTGLSHLRIFLVDHNHLTGSIPALSGLSSLKWLRVGDNALTGNAPTVPAEVTLWPAYPAASSLCPNPLTYTDDSAWDAATGRSPWYNNCSVATPRLASVSSRKTHGSAGTFDLPLSSTATDPTTEPRFGGANGNHTIVFTFDKPVIHGSAAVWVGTAKRDTPKFNGNEMVVPLTGVADKQYVTITVTQVVSADGGSDGSSSVRIGFLAGDVNGSRTVSLSDMLFVNAVLTQPVTASSFIRDVNGNGTLTLSDLLLINANLVQTLPPP